MNELNEKDFKKILEELSEFNENSGTRYRIDYEYIHDIQNMETNSYNFMKNAYEIRKLNVGEMKDVLEEYAKSSFNIQLNKQLTFHNMISELTDKIMELNNEYDDTEEENESQEGLTLFDMIYSYDMIMDIGKDEGERPPIEALTLLKNGIEEIDYIKVYGEKFLNISKLTEDEIEDIIDPDFII